MDLVAAETLKRKTFAIISHPDAGKTTLTEKLLLYGGAIQLAGSVKAKRNQRKATSDWMELERERGISITSTVLQFHYEGHVINLLDTPGHEDFSADTYRTLTAADSAVMLIDNAKGVETQTKKLYAVCSQKGLPIFTFVNKMDHYGKGPLALLSEVEDVLGIRTAPINWPIGQGGEFKGVYDRLTGMVHLYDRSAHGATRARTTSMAITDPGLEAALGAERMRELHEEIELLDIAGETFDEEQFQQGAMSPVFFGSALSNFGVEPFLRHFLALAPGPSPRLSRGGLIGTSEPFSGFVFKIQANMDPQHRDRVAFLRIVSGRFEKDMEVTHGRSGKRLRLTRPQRVFAQDRETVSEAFPGDVVGLTNPGSFRLGDTLSVETGLRYDEVPHFLPESFAILMNEDVARLKQFNKGLNQLTEEGLVDVFHDAQSHRNEPILGAVGTLQFEVVKHRLASEYGVNASVQLMPHTVIRWVMDNGDLPRTVRGSHIRLLIDAAGRKVVVGEDTRAIEFLARYNPELRLFSTAAELDAAVVSKAG